MGGNNLLSIERSADFERFEVPVVTFTVTPSADVDAPVAFRFAVDLPEGFPQDRVSLHPDYKSRQWSLVDDRFLVFEGIVEPEDDLATLFGVRLDETRDIEAFLEESPRVIQAEEFTDITGDDSELVTGTEAEESMSKVHEILGSLKLSLLPTEDAESESTRDIDTESREPVALETDAESTQSITPESGGSLAPQGDADRDAPSGDPGDVESDDPDGGVNEPDWMDPGVQSAESDEPTPTAEETPGEPAASGSADDAEGDDLFDPSDGTQNGHAGPVEGEDADVASGSAAADRSESAGADGEAESVVASLVAEIERGNASEDELATLRDALAVDTSKSVRVQLRRLQGKIEEFATYSESLREFIDEQGTGQQIIEDFQTYVEDFEARVEDLESRFDALAQEIEEANTGRNDLRRQMTSLEEDVDALVGIDEQLTDLHDDLTALQADQRADRDDLDARIDAVGEEIEAVRESVTAVENSLDDDLSALRDDIAEINEWREGFIQAVGQSVVSSADD